MSQERTSTQTNGKSSVFNQGSEFTKAASQTFEEGKRQAKNLYQEGKEKLSEVEDNIEEYAGKLADSVKENPITSILIAAGIGYILSTLLRK